MTVLKSDIKKTSSNGVRCMRNGVNGLLEFKCKLKIDALRG